MGISRLSQAINALQGAGIRADRGFPAASMPDPSDPVAAVFVDMLTAEESRLAVVIYTTAAQGGILCEDTAYLAKQTLETLGARCTAGSCSFSGVTGLFSVKVTAVFQELLPFRIMVDGVVQSYVTALVIEKATDLSRVTDAETGTVSTNQVDEGWRLTLTEALPANTPPAQQTGENVTITVEHPGGMEQYPQCLWEQVTLQRTPAGMCRTRVARTWAEKMIAQG